MPRPPPPISKSPSSPHLSQGHLEAFAMGKSLGMHAERVHSHLLACDYCCLRLVKEAEFIEALRYALRKYYQQRAASSAS
jgi:hypothetical protein